MGPDVTLGVVPRAVKWIRRSKHYTQMDGWVTAGAPPPLTFAAALVLLVLAENAATISYGWGLGARLSQVSVASLDCFDCDGFVLA
jgi:hypothetical protein